jgi:hypothetical protein
MNGLIIVHCVAIYGRLAMPNGQSCGGDIVVGLTLLLIIFVVLKLSGYIAWTWWWVLSPIWFPPAFAVVFVATWVLMYRILKAQ